MASRVPEVDAAREAMAFATVATASTVSPDDVLQRLMHDGIFDALKNKILADLKQNVRTTLHWKDEIASVCKRIERDRNV